MHRFEQQRRVLLEDPAFEVAQLGSRVEAELLDQHLARRRQRTQRVGPIGDPTSDALFVVVAGEVVIQVDRGRKRVKQWSAVLAPAGGEVTISNASTEPAVILVTAAPPPASEELPASPNGATPDDRI